MSCPGSANPRHRCARGRLLSLRPVEYVASADWRWDGNRVYEFSGPLTDCWAHRASWRNARAAEVRIGRYDANSYGAVNLAAEYQQVVATLRPLTAATFATALDAIKRGES